MMVLDTDHISILQRGDSPASSRLRERLATLPDAEVTTTIITAEEQLRGWLHVLAGKGPGSKQADGDERGGAHRKPSGSRNPLRKGRGMRGRRTALEEVPAYEDLSRFFEFYSTWKLLPFDVKSADQFE